MRLQFTLASLMLVFVLVALSLGVFGAAGLIVAAAVVYVRVAKLKGRAWFCVALLAILYLLWTVVSRYHSDDFCRANTHNLGLALLNCELISGKLPPVCDRDAQTKVPVSWRVAISNYLDFEPISATYNRKEPWNGPNNSKLAATSPYAYVCSHGRDGGSQGKTNYVAVTGPDGNWLRTGNSSSGNASGVGSNPALLIETTGLGIAWSEPRDLSVDEICRELPDGSRPGFHSGHISRGGFFFHDAPGRVAIGWADGRSSVVSPDVPTDLLKAALLGDREKQAELERCSSFSVRRLNWPNCAALASLVLCVGLMLAWPRKKPEE